MASSSNDPKTIDFEIFQNMRDSDEGIDCHVQGSENGKLFPAHQAVLMAASPYFTTMLLEPTEKKSKSKSIRLVRLGRPTMSDSDIQDDVVQSLLDICYENYTSQTFPNFENDDESVSSNELTFFKQFFQATDMLLLNKAMEYVSYHFSSKSVEEKLQVVDIAISVPIAKDLTRLTGKHYIADKFLPRLVPHSADLMKFFVANKKLAILGEHKIVTAVQNWFSRVDTTTSLERRTHLAKLFQSICLESLDLASLQALNNLFPDLADVFAGPMFEATEPGELFCSIRPTDNLGLVCITTFTISTEKKLRVIRDFVINIGKYKHTDSAMPSIKSPLIFLPRNGCIYLFRAADDNEKCGQSVTFELNLHGEKQTGYEDMHLMVLCDSFMKTFRPGCAICELDDAIYFIGGETCQEYCQSKKHHYSSTDVSTVRMYNSKINEESDSKLCHGRIGAACAVLSDKRIYVAGGFTWKSGSREAGNKRIILSSVESHAWGDGWKETPPMPTGRFDSAACCGPDGCLYVLGGKDDEGNPVATVERYDPKTQTWSTLAPMKTPRFSFTAAATRNQILVGDCGFNEEAEEDVQEKEDEDNENVKKVTYYPNPNKRLRADGSGTVPSMEVYDIGSNTWYDADDSDLKILGKFPFFVRLPQQIETSSATHSAWQYEMEEVHRLRDSMEAILDDRLGAGRLNSLMLMRASQIW